MLISNDACVGDVCNGEKNACSHMVDIVTPIPFDGQTITEYCMQRKREVLAHTNIAAHINPLERIRLKINVITL